MTLLQIEDMSTGYNGVSVVRNLSLHVDEGDFRRPEELQPAGGPYDVVVSNPPYVRSADIPGLMPEVRDHDPADALDGGPDGLDALRDLARQLTSVA